MSKEDKLIGRIAKSLKWGGVVLFIGANALLFHHYLGAYQDGQTRGQLLHKQKQAKKKASGKVEAPKAMLPQELQPQYIEKQVRKYKMLAKQQH